MRPSVSLEKDGGLTLRDFSSKEAADISSIDFYVAAAVKKPIQVFLHMVDRNTGLTEIVELHSTNNGYGKPVFRVPLTYSLRFTNTSVQLKVMAMQILKLTIMNQRVKQR